MKKSRVILAVLMALVMLLTLSFAVACADNNNPDQNGGNPDSSQGNQGNQGGNQGGQGNQGGDPQPAGSWALQKITLSGSYKTEYNVNEAFSANGLTVSATMMNTVTKQTRTDDVTSAAVINSSKFNSAVVGVYVITVSYTNTGVTRYAHYNVTVLPYEPQINGITISKTQVDYDVPNGQASVSVNVDDVVVKAIDAQGDEEQTPLAAADYTLTYYKDGQPVESLNEATKGAYTIQAERNSDHQKAFVIVYVLDPAVKVEFKSGTTQQSQALTDNMTADWLFAVTNRSGATHDVGVDSVELSSINTLVAGSYSVTANYNEYDCKGQLASADGFAVAVGYTIIKNNDMVNQSYAVNISNITTSKLEITEANEATDGVLSAEGGVSLIAGSRTITIESNSGKCGSKSFTYRLKFGGKSDTNGGRQIKLQVKGASLITVYAKSGSSSSARGLGLYSDSAMGTRLDNTEPMLGTIVPLTYLVEAAGTYYLAAPDGDLNIYYIQIDTVLTGEAAEGQQSVELPTATVVSGITLNTDNVKKDFVKGDTFTYAGLVVSKTIYNPVTAEASSEPVTEGYDVSTPDMSVQGNPTVTVTYQGKTATYTINVNSLVDGVNGIKVSTEKSTVELDNEGDTVEIKQADFTVTTDSGAAIVTGTEAGQCSNVKFELFAENGTEPLSSWIVGAGTYKVKVTATYNNSTIAGTTDFTAECTVTVKVKAASGTQPQTYKWLSDTLTAGTITAETAWTADVAETNGNVVSLTAAADANVVIEANSKTHSDGSAFANRIKLGGTGKVESRSVKITVTDKATIIIYALSSSGTAPRTVQLLKQDGSELDLVAAGATLDGTAFTADTTVDGTLRKIEITVEAGTYYFGSKSGGLNVYGVTLEVGVANA